MVKQDALCLLCLIVVNLSLGNYLLGLFASGLTKLFAFIGEYPPWERIPTAPRPQKRPAKEQIWMSPRTNARIASTTTKRPTALFFIL